MSVCSKDKAEQSTFQSKYISQYYNSWIISKHLVSWLLQHPIWAVNSGGKPGKLSRGLVWGQLLGLGPPEGLLCGTHPQKNIVVSKKLSVQSLSNRMA